jgi:ATP-binding cassette subfamily F protein 3
MALNEFEGTVMLVSHDRALLRAVCDEFWLVSRGGIGPFDGDLDDYQRYLLDEAKRQREALKEANAAAAAAASAPPPPPVVATPESARPRREDNRTRQLRKEFEQCESRMAELAQEKAELEERLGGQPDMDEINELGKRLGALQDELDQLEARWLELSSELGD